MVILGFPDDTDFEAIGDQLETLGFARPDGDEGSGSAGRTCWRGSDRS